jgi:hypothetical protein
LCGYAKVGCAAAEDEGEPRAQAFSAHAAWGSTGSSRGRTGSGGRRGLAVVHWVPVGPPRVALLGAGARLDVRRVVLAHGAEGIRDASGPGLRFEGHGPLLPGGESCSRALFVSAEPDQLSEGFDVLAEGGVGAGGVAIR